MKVKDIAKYINSLPQNATVGTLNKTEDNLFYSLNLEDMHNFKLYNKQEVREIFEREEIILKEEELKFDYYLY